MKEAAIRLGRWSLGLAAVLFAVCACKGGSSSGEGGAQAKGAALKLGAALSMTGAAATYQTSRPSMSENDGSVDFVPSSQPELSG